VRSWGLEVLCENPEEYSSSLTAVMMPQGNGADALLDTVLDHFDMSLGIGLGKVKGKIFRIGHLGHFNDLMLAGTLAGIEMGLSLAGISFKKGGVAAALEYLEDTHRQEAG
jgi:alanine-glyoxylate transaminase/serine-glyoxylate transaminase/serine-pyruvate transaminase